MNEQPVLNAHNLTKRYGQATLLDHCEFALMPGEVLELIPDVKARGMPTDLISHNMPHVFEVADRIHRPGQRLCVIDPNQYTMSDAVAFITGEKALDAQAA